LVTKLQISDTDTGKPKEVKVAVGLM